MAAIFVVATILAFLAVDWIVQKRRAKTMVPAAAGLAFEQPVSMRLPDGVFFSRSHTWLSLFPSGKVRLGIDDFVANLFEKAEITLVKNPGDHVARGDALMVLAEHGQAVTVMAPISGEVVALNDKLEGAKGLKMRDLFSEGWAYTVQPDNPEELRTLLIGKETRSWMAQEMSRLRDFFAHTLVNGLAAPALQDGGVPAPGALLHLDADAWKRFEQEFLQAR